MLMITEIHSRGLYSTWLYLPSINTLIDCGEGIASRLRNRCFGIKRIVFSHDHTDHISGLDTLINVRNLGFGNKDTPLEIFHPPKAPNLLAMREYLQKTQKNLKFKITWKTLEHGKNIPVSKSKFIRPFRVEHGRTEAFGFAIIEPYTKLKAEYTHLEETEISRMTKNGVDLKDPYEKKILVYSGDCWKIPPKEIDGTDYLFLDTTFLTNKDRDNESNGTPKERKHNPTHASLEENLELLKKVKVHKMVFFHHLSPRYNTEEISKAQQNLPKKHQILPPGQNTLFNPNKKSPKTTKPTKPKQNKKNKSEPTLEP